MVKQHNRTWTRKEYSNVKRYGTFSKHVNGMAHSSCGLLHCSWCRGRGRMVSGPAWGMRAAARAAVPTERPVVSQQQPAGGELSPAICSSLRSSVSETGGDTAQLHTSLTQELCSCNPRSEKRFHLRVDWPKVFNCTDSNIPMFCVRLLFGLAWVTPLEW